MSRQIDRPPIQIVSGKLLLQNFGARIGTGLPRVEQLPARRRRSRLGKDTRKGGLPSPLAGLHIIGFQRLRVAAFGLFICRGTCRVCGSVKRIEEERCKRSAAQRARRLRGGRCFHERLIAYKLDA